MQWAAVREAHPDQWLVVEVLGSHAADEHRVVDRVAVIETCPDGRTTMKRYGELHRRHPTREFCFVHTSVSELKMEERLWLGVRGIRATDRSL